MAKAKKKLIKLKSTESSHFYTTEKNATNTPKKLELRKFDPKIRKHVVYKEEKVK